MSIDPEAVEIETTQETNGPGSSFVDGRMKAGGKVLGSFKLNVPYRKNWNNTGDDGIPYYVVIDRFEILPELQGKGNGRACYFALERVILEKHDPQNIYLRSSDEIDPKHRNPTGFWERVGYKMTEEPQMIKRFTPGKKNDSRTPLTS